MKTSILKTKHNNYQYHSIFEFAQKEGFDVRRLPISLKIILENLLRHSNRGNIRPADLAAVAGWRPRQHNQRKDIAFHPVRVIMQDLTGGPAIADLAALREALNDAGRDSSMINPQIPVDIVIDHSVMVDYSGTGDSFSKNVQMEFRRNKERYRFFKWAQDAFKNIRVVPPGTGIVHQVNLEYLASVVAKEKRTDGSPPLVFPDTLVGTDSHTTMINGLSVLGWGVGGIEAEAAMLGQPLTMLIPDIVGFRFSGKFRPGVTATDLVLKVVKILRTHDVVGSFVEFFGPGLDNLTLADRATISNMAPEYGATCGYFPVDEEVLNYLRLTGREEEQVDLVETYAKLQGLWREDHNPTEYTDVISLDLSSVESAVAGPRRPQDLVPLAHVPKNFETELRNGFQSRNPESAIPIEDMDHNLKHGDVVIAAITSCTNTSNPDILIAAGLLARKAVELGLRVKPWVKTSFAPGSQVVTSYLKEAGLMEDLDKLGFNLTAYGCTTCIGNSGPLPQHIADAIVKGDLVTVNILSGNRNFEGRIHPLSKASYLASPPLVVLYALTGSIRTDLSTEPLGRSPEGKNIYLKDLWPDASEIHETVNACLKPELFRQKYREVYKGPKEWNNLGYPESLLYDWQEESTYIRKPTFFNTVLKTSGPQILSDIEDAKCLAIFPDSTTTDHISPAGNIPVDSPAGMYLLSRGVKEEDFNSYGSRRANHEVMMRGTFANIRIKNKMNPDIEGGYTSGSNGRITSIFDAAATWKRTPLVIIAGKEYGTGSSRDWAAKGPLLLGVKAVIAESYERIHRSNLLGMGILPLEFQKDVSVDSLGLKGDETFSIKGVDMLVPSGELRLEISRTDGPLTAIPLKVRIDTDLELKYIKSGGILNYVLTGLFE